MLSDKSVIAVAGMPGSGKSVFVSIAMQDGYKTIVMGDEVREETKRRNLPINPENVAKVMLELRKIEGEAAIAKRCIPKIEASPSQKVVVDGVRSLSEADEFRKHFKKLVLVAIHSSPETRFRRIFNRQRTDDPRTWEVFRERDFRELGVGLGNAIAMSEHIIINEGAISRTKGEARAILRKVEARWTK